MTKPRSAEQARATFIAHTPPKSRGILERAFDGTASKRTAIKAMCLSCSAFDRDEIEHCQVVLCPLHAYRPRFSKKAVEAISQIS